MHLWHLKIIIKIKLLCIFIAFLSGFHSIVLCGVQVAGHPRNNLRHGRWYAAVERLESEEDDAWVVIATDADWETK